MCGKIPYMLYEYVFLSECNDYLILSGSFRTEIVNNLLVSILKSMLLYLHFFCI